MPEPHRAPPWRLVHGVGHGWPERLPLPLPPTDHVGKAQRRQEAELLHRLDRRWANRASHLNRRARRAGVEGQVTAAQLRWLVASYGSRCAYCGTPLRFELNRRTGKPKGTFDHVRPLRARGTGDVGNLVPSCAPCNHRRSLWPDSALGVPAPHRELGDPQVQAHAQQWWLERDPLAAEARRYRARRFRSKKRRLEP